jgi:hypothetical protein
MRSILGVLLLAASWAGAGELTLATADGRDVQPLRTDAKAAVFIFTRADCPISNRYAPEIERLYERYSREGLDFWLVYVDPSQTPAVVRAHLKEFGYRCGALLDPKHELVAAAGVTITPEAAVFTRGRLLYRGRIDDRYVDFGKTRPAASTHDLEDILAAVAAGKSVLPRTTKATGCFIEDLK